MATRRPILTARWMGLMIALTMLLAPLLGLAAPAYTAAPAIVVVWGVSGYGAATVPASAA